MLNRNFKLSNMVWPYKIWIIDNFLEKKVIDNIDENWVSQDSGLWGSGYAEVDGKKNILEEGMMWLNDYKLMPEEISYVLKYFHTDDFTNKLSVLTRTKDLITDKSRNWSGMRTMLPDSHQLIHSDARTHPVNGLRKELTCLLYLNEDYKGGKTMLEKIHIKPRIGRVSIFNSKNIKIFYEIKNRADKVKNMTSLSERDLREVLNLEETYGVPEVQELLAISPFLSMVADKLKESREARKDIKKSKFLPGTEIDYTADLKAQHIKELIRAENEIARVAIIQLRTLNFDTLESDIFGTTYNQDLYKRKSTGGGTVSNQMFELFKK